MATTLAESFLADLEDLSDDEVEAQRDEEERGDDDEAVGREWCGCFGGGTRTMMLCAHSSSAEFLVEQFTFQCS